MPNNDNNREHERSKGKTANKGNSGTAEVEVGFEEVVELLRRGVGVTVVLCWGEGKAGV